MARGALRLAKARPLTPAPPSQLAAKTTLMTWPKGQVIHRIHLDRYGPAQFNPGLAGNARFSPIKNEEGGVPIPTLYGGTSFDCSAMETVFHDVPFTARLKTLDKARLAGQVHSRLEPRQDLLLVDLCATALRRLGVRRNPAHRYGKGPLSRHACLGRGLPCGSSRGAGPVLDFPAGRPRPRPRPVRRSPSRRCPGPVGGQRVLLGSGEALTELTGLADRIGVKLVAGKA